jgi:hypothetical protein
MNKPEDEFQLPPLSESSVFIIDEVRMTGDNIDLVKIDHDIESSGIIIKPGKSGVGHTDTESVQISVPDEYINNIRSKLVGRYGNSGVVTNITLEDALVIGDDYLPEDKWYQIPLPEGLEEVRNGVPKGVIGIVGNGSSSLQMRLRALELARESNTVLIIENENSVEDSMKTLKQSEHSATSNMLIGTIGGNIPDYIGKKVNAASYYGEARKPFSGPPSQPFMNRKRRRALKKNVGKLPKR